MDDPSELIGRTLAGKFVIEHLLGAGAMGAVYRARQVALDKVVAVKVLRPQLAKDDAFVARFHREARAASRVEHPGVIRVLDYGEALLEGDGARDAVFYIAMEHLDGRNLLRVLAEEYPLAPERVVSILSQVLGALAAAHEGGVLHRDLKPENVMIRAATDEDGTSFDRVTVLDFGVAKITQGAERSDAEGAPSEVPTLQGILVGTPEYMAPEQGRGEPVDARCDVYAAGVLLYQMLCARVPFEAESPLGVVMRHLVEAPTPPSVHAPWTNVQLEEVCLRAMRKDRAQRYPSARAMRADLRARFRDLPLVDVSRPIEPRRLVLLEASEVPAPVTPTAEDTPTNELAPAHEALALPVPQPGASVLPAPRGRSPLWQMISLVVGLASVAAAATLASGRPLGALLAELDAPGAAATTTRAPRTRARIGAARVARSAHNLLGWTEPPTSAPAGRAAALAPEGAPTPGDAARATEAAPTADATSRAHVAAARVAAPAVRLTPSTTHTAPTAPAVAIAATGSGPLPPLPTHAASPPARPRAPSAAPPSPPPPVAEVRPNLPADAPVAPLPEAPAGRAVRVTLGAISAVGLDEPPVRRLLASALPRVTRCYEDALRSGATRAQGALTATLETGTGGAVSRVAFAGLELPALTEHCMVDALLGGRIEDAVVPGVATATLELAQP